MIIGFLGKGGSGKSTLSTYFAKYLLEKGGRVLAIDGDHNMDLTHNLRGDADGLNYLGQSLPDLLASSPGAVHYSDLLFTDRRPQFSIVPPDPFTKKYAHAISDDLYIMAGGPHTDKVRFGQSCSHVLTTALKAYLPLLKLNLNESVILDEKAGADGAGTGIVTGLSMAIITAEPTSHSVKAAHQIADLLDFFRVPYEFVVNKAERQENPGLRNEPLGFVQFSNPSCADFSSANAVFDKIRERGLALEKSDSQARFKRSRAKFERNREFIQNND